MRNDEPRKDDTRNHPKSFGALLQSLDETKVNKLAIAAVAGPYIALRHDPPSVASSSIERMGSLKTGKKRSHLSVFDAIEELETEDVRLGTQRRKKSTKQTQRAQAAQSQSKIYNHLVECRILLQRAVMSNHQDLESEPFEDSCNLLLENLLQARQHLTAGATTEDDEEGNEYSEMVRTSSLEEFQETLQQEYETCRDQWKKILDQRHKDLKLHAGLTAKSQFRVLDSSFWEQVDAAIEYEGLRRKGKDDEEHVSFDDSKVYQQILKDFVAYSTRATDGGGAGDRLKTSSKSTQSAKKQVDRRASKGRKIRYKEIPKLVNFTFPLSRPNTSGLDQDEWFKSLFGGAGNM